MNPSESAVDSFMEEAVTSMNRSKQDSPLQLLSQLLQQFGDSRKSPTSVGTRSVVVEMGIISPQKNLKSNSTEKEHFVVSPKKHFSADERVVNSLIQELLESNEDDSIKVYTPIRLVE
jgi:hypothetical protein